MVSRVLRDFGSGAGTGKAGAKVLVLSDEAHHCYQDKPLVAIEHGANGPEAEALEAQTTPRSGTPPSESRLRPVR